MYAGVMFSEKQGYTFGEKGVVLRTDDGGSTWTKGDHYSLAFQAAYIFDMNNLFLVGDDGFLQSQLMVERHASIFHDSVEAEFSRVST